MPISIIYSNLNLCFLKFPTGLFSYLIVFFSYIKGFLFKKRAKANDWSNRWFVLNERSGKVGFLFKHLTSRNVISNFHWVFTTLIMGQ